MVNGSPADFRTQNWGWAYQILPHVEQEALYRNKNDYQVAYATPPLFYCPTLGPPARNDYSNGMMHYGASGGSGIGNVYDGILVPSSAPLFPGVKLTTSLDNIPDGTSGTLMLGEKALNIVLVQTGKSDCNNDQGWVDNWDNDTVVYGGFVPLTDVSIKTSYCGDQDDGSWSGSAFGSAHPAGFQVAFADGSVRFVVLHHQSAGPALALDDRRRPRDFEQCVLRWRHPKRCRVIVESTSIVDRKHPVCGPRSTTSRAAAPSAAICGKT